MRLMMNTWSRIRLGTVRLSVVSIYVVAIMLALVSNVGYSQSVTLDDIKVTEATSGASRTFGELASGGTVAIIFFCNDCPYSGFYLDRIKQLTKEHSETRFILVNSFPEDPNSVESLDRMAAYKKQHSLTMPYIADRSQQLMAKLNARKCPEAVVIVAVKGGWNKVFQGAIDNNPQVAADATARYLSSVLSNPGGYSGPAFQRPIGCNIKKI